MLTVTNHVLAYSEVLFPIYEFLSQVTGLYVTKFFVLRQWCLLFLYIATVQHQPHAFKTYLLKSCQNVNARFYIILFVHPSFVLKIRTKIMEHNTKCNLLAPPF